MSRHLALAFSLLILSSSGCSSPASTPEETESIKRGPHILSIDGDPNGLWWDDAEQTLYLADDNGNRILKWTDDAGFSTVAQLPAAPPQGAGLGQLVRLSDGTFVVTRFGHGSAGGVITLSPSGESSLVPELDPQRRRIGLTITNEQKLYSSWFVRLSSGERVGAIGALALEGEEAEVVTGLRKPVGVLAMGDWLYISDQELGQLLKTSLSNPGELSVVAQLNQPDQIAAGPSGSLLVGGAGGELLRVNQDGAVSVIDTGYQQVRCVVYDPTNRRAFVADHDPDEADGISHALRIIPLED